MSIFFGKSVEQAQLNALRAEIGQLRGNLRVLSEAHGKLREAHNAVVDVLADELRLEVAEDVFGMHPRTFEMYQEPPKPPVVVRKKKDKK